MKLLHLLLGVSVLATAACGGGGDGGGTTQPPGGNAQTFSTIRLGSTTASIGAGATTSLNPTALDTKGAAISGVGGFTYATSNASVAEVGSGGVILGVGAGTATITVSLTRDGVTASSTATVTVTGVLPSVGTVAAGSADNTFAPATIVVARNATVTFTFGALQHNVDVPQCHRCTGRRAELHQRQCGARLPHGRRLRLRLLAARRHVRHDRGAVMPRRA